MKLGLKTNIVKICKYDQKWKKEYYKQEKVLKKLLSGFNVQIEHIGSTSIVGCSAKPIIDIAIGVLTLEYGKQIIPILLNNGWVHTGDSDFGVRWFLKKQKGKFSTHYIHIEAINTRIWQNHIVFRDYLNAHPEFVEKYSKLKEDCKSEFAVDRRSYAKHKDPFIEKIIEKAVKELNIERVPEDYQIK